MGRWSLVLGRVIVLAVLGGALLAPVGGCGLSLDTDPPDPGSMFDGGDPAHQGDAGPQDDAGSQSDGGPEDDAAIALDAGDAATGCVSERSCDDGDACTADVCAGGACTSAAIACRPDACHISLGCDPSTGCLLEPIDEDDDGFTLRVPMICGEDCDDANAEIHPGALEVCDGLDQNCDGRIDEGVSIVCGRDLDGDRFGSSTDVVPGCGACPTGYVMTLGDCWDEAVMLANLAHPGQRTYFGMPRGPAGSGSYDWSCDAIEEPQLPSVVFVMCPEIPPAAVDCGTFSGWSSVIPECGASAAYVRCFTTAGGGCTPSTSTSTQVCR